MEGDESLGEGTRCWAFLKDGADFIPPSVRGQVEELLNGRRLAKAQTYSERTLPETHRVLHTHLSMWSHKVTLDTHILILLTLRNIHTVTHTQRHTQRHSQTHPQAVLHPSMVTQRYTFTHTLVHNILTGKRAHTKTHTCTLKYIHTDTNRNTTIPTPAHPGHPQRHRHTKPGSDTFTHSCTQACTLEYILTVKGMHLFCTHPCIL